MEYLITRGDELYHFGVLGMRWGHHKQQSANVSNSKPKNDDLILKKGYTVKRISVTAKDETYDNKKYVSINDSDTDKWDEYLGKQYILRGKGTFRNTYVTTKDLRVMSATKEGEIYANMLKDKQFRKQAEIDTKYANQMLGQKKSKDLSENITRNMMAQTRTAKAFTAEVQRLKYDAIIDTHGTDVAKTPVIVLNPDTNLKRTKSAEYTKTISEYVREEYGQDIYDVFGTPA